MIVTTRFPVIMVDGMSVTIVVGQPTTQFGEEILLDTRFERAASQIHYVAGVDTVHACDVSAEVLDLFGLESTEHFIESLARLYGTALPDNVDVTIYTLCDRPVHEC